MRPLRLKTVVVATDLDPSSLPALRSAHLLAEAAGADLHVVQVADGDFGSPGGARAGAEPMEALLRRAGVPAGGAATHVIPGAPAPAIRALADRIAADTIVVGPPHHGASVPGRPLGSTARELVERTFVPILVTPRTLALPLGEVLVPIDLSETARGALLVALTWASALRRRTSGTREPTCVTALHVTTDRETAAVQAAVTAALDPLRQGAARWGGVSLRELVVASGDPATTIVTQAADLGADLVVLGTRNEHTREVQGLGSVSAAVAAAIETPTLLVPPGVWQAFGGDG